MRVELLDFIKSTIESFGMQILFLKPPYEDASKFEFGLRSKIFGDFKYDILINDILESCNPNTLYTVRNRFFMYHSYFRFPESVEKEYGYTHCIIGPFLAGALSDEDFSSILRKNSIESQYERNLRVFYSKIPVIPTLETWNTMILGFCKHIFNCEVNLVQNTLENESIFSLHYNSFSIQPDMDFSTDTIEHRYYLENQFLEAIRKGDYAEATQRFSEWTTYKLLPRHGDSLRDAKNITIVTSTLCRKAVEQANVHPVYIDELSRKIAIEIESCTTLTQIANLKTEIIRKYCLLIKNYSRSGYSQLIHKCLDYVDFHYMDQITLKSLSEQFFVSNTHLSALFKKEVDQNLKEYIQEVRLRQARLLLNTTRLPIQEIATNCGFMDVNYFTRVFRKVHGISPRTYRNKMQNINDEE